MITLTLIISCLIGGGGTLALSQGIYRITKACRGRLSGDDEETAALMADCLDMSDTQEPIVHEDEVIEVLKQLEVASTPPSEVADEELEQAAETGLGDQLMESLEAIGSADDTDETKSSSTERTSVETHEVAVVEMDPRVSGQRWAARTPRERHRFSALIAREVRGEYPLLMERNKANELMVMRMVVARMREHGVRPGAVGRLATVSVALVFTPDEADLLVSKYYSSEVFQTRMEAMQTGWWNLTLKSVIRWAFEGRPTTRDA